MRALDLFCGAGGAGMGLHRAGFDVVGVDLKPQPRYPFEFHEADATTYPIEGFDFVWASPPCQRFTSLNVLHKKEHPNLIPVTRQRQREAGVFYAIENVPGAPLEAPLMLCGTQFGLATRDGRAELRRHRLFESNIPTLLLTRPCAHRRRSIGVYGHAGGRSHREKTQQFVTSEWAEAMGIDWMVGSEFVQAIPPVYSEYVARYAADLLTQADH